jgi:PQQ-dependent catabolism-associated CXXCW motif protein
LRNDRATGKIQALPSHEWSQVFGSELPIEECEVRASYACHLGALALMSSLILSTAAGAQGFPPTGPGNQSPGTTSQNPYSTPPQGQYGAPPQNGFGAPPPGQFGGSPPQGQFGGAPPQGQFGGQPPQNQFGDRPNLADELTDFHIQPQATLQTNVGSETPLSIPGGHVITTNEMRQTQGAQILLVDVWNSGQPHPTLPGALWLPGAGNAGSFNDDTQQKLWQALSQATNSKQDYPMVFFCIGSRCWESYNAALRAVNMGFKMVLWYRGGLAAWQAAGLPLAQPGQGGVPPGGAGLGGGPGMGGQSMPGMGAPGQGMPQQGGFPH